MTCTKVKLIKYDQCLRNNNIQILAEEGGIHLREMRRRGQWRTGSARCHGRHRTEAEYSLGFLPGNPLGFSKYRRKEGNVLFNETLYTFYL